MGNITIVFNAPKTKFLSTNIYIFLFINNFYGWCFIAIMRKVLFVFEYSYIMLYT